MTRVLAACMLLSMLVTMGCRSAAQQDVYTEKMAGRIRVLEDRLNEAEYQNHVLRQELSRAELSGSANQFGDDSRSGANRSRGATGSGLSRESQGDRGGSSFELGSPLDTDTLPEPILPDISIGDPVDGASTELDSPTTDSELDSSDLIPPPTRALPPRREDLKPPPIEMGNPLPPRGEDTTQLPPGQIPTPAGTRDLFPPPPSIPVAAKIHMGLTGIHHTDSDNEVDGLYLVLSPVDEKGQHVTADTPLSVVVLDPAREGDAARLGRWDFKPGEVRVSYREAPTPSFQLPILWQDKRPAGDEVAVFIRFTLEDGTQLQSDVMLPLTQPRVVDWRSRELGTQTPSFRRAVIDAAEAWR